MAGWGYVFRCSVLVAVGTALVTACGPSGSGSQPSSGAASSSSLAATVPAGYDPCTDIPQSITDPVGLVGKTPDDNKASGGIVWQGCTWADPDGYAATIQVTNITLDAVRDKHFPGAREFDIDGRRAITSNQVDGQPEDACTLDIEMKGGSLEINLTNPDSAPKTGKQDTCQLARDLAEKVVPTVPASA